MICYGNLKNDEVIQMICFILDKFTLKPLLTMLIR